MDVPSYKRAVMKTLSVKPAKEGMKVMMRKIATLNVAHGIVGLKSETGELLEGLQPYLLGHQLNDTMRHNAMEELGDCAYYMTVLCRTLHVSLPASTKKVALKGMTLSKALLDLDKIATDLLDQFKKTFYGRELNIETITKLLKEFVPLYYAVCFTLFGAPVAVVMDGNIAKLSARYPKGYFDNDAQHARDKKKELAAMDAAVKPTEMA